MSCPVITEESLYLAVAENHPFQHVILTFCILCSIGSTLVLVSIYRAGQFTPHILLVASLSFADLVLSTESLFFVTIFNQKPDLVRGCQTDALFSTFGVLVSIISFGMLTIERYLVICHGVQKHTLKTLISIGLAFTYAIVVSSVISVSPEHVDLAGGMLCRPLFCSQTLTMLIINYSFILIVFGFLSSVIYCPYKILQIYSTATTSAMDSILKAENHQAIIQKKARERKVFIKLSIVTAFFVIMVGPLAIALVYEIFTKSLSPPALVYLYMLGLGGNSALNPILLYNFDISVRTRVNQLLGIKAKLRTIATPTSHSNLAKLKSSEKSPKDTISFDAKDTVKMTLNQSTSRIPPKSS